MTAELTPELTQDKFLGGRIKLWQPARGYRAGVDPVFLAASINARAGQSVLDLGCGAGAASLCLGARVDGLRLVGLERQAAYAELARRNAVENAADFDVVEGDLSDMPPALRQQRFDHVMANPPYFLRSASVAATDAGREGALGEDTPLINWVEAAAKRCAPGGTVTFIHRVARLPELITEFHRLLGSVELVPLIPRIGRESQLCIVRARKGGRAEFRIRPGLIVHNDTAHSCDKTDYSPDAARILKDAAAMPFLDNPVEN
ncbi:tRNA1(Val) (adenine(37)-N6)-methyltransferase [Pseudooceanicola sp. C21-150M6]|uniref:tRNA1(Val) (adenine(37)-N6)-methyltransferase n=1 Tax=Pseudooceanicola sp. C21-150M6 TaxID=3434355 RepID=UPI003D7F4801